MTKLYKKDIIKIIDDYKLDKNEILIISGAAMVLYGYKKYTTDIDIAVSKKYYNYLLKKYSCVFERINEYGEKIYFIDNIINFGNTYYSSPYEIIDGLRVQTRNDLITLKENLNRKKDIEEINKIKYNNIGGDNMGKPKVYFSKEITPEKLIEIYEKLGVNLTGKVGVKVSTGEDGAKGYLKADLIAPLVKKLNGTIIECNTSYPGARTTYEEHIKVAEKHGFTSFADVDIMDKDGDFEIPFEKGKYLKYDKVGINFKNYDSILNLAHGKGHMMGGFGANLKNQSIGIASRHGKAYIHSCGQTEDPDACWQSKHEQVDFIKSMAEAATAVADYLKENNKPIAYITVMNALSVDCDCDANQSDPVMEDLGIVASLDPVANDQAFIDMIWASKDPGAEKLKERIDTREGREILPYAESLGLGSREYELIEI